jgi:hypothetical protein
VQSQGSVSGTVTEADVRQSLVYDDQPGSSSSSSGGVALTPEQQRQADYYAQVEAAYNTPTTTEVDRESDYYWQLEQAYGSSEDSADAEPGSLGAEAVERNTALAIPSSVQSGEDFTNTITDFQEQTIGMGSDNCTVAGTDETCVIDGAATDEAFQEGLSTNIYNPATQQGSSGGQTGGSTTPPITTTMNDLGEPTLVVPDDLAGDPAIQNLEPAEVGGGSADGVPFDPDDLTWEQAVITDEDRTFDWSIYIEYKSVGYNMTGTQWLGEGRFFVPEDFFYRFNWELLPHQSMSSRDQQISNWDRRITYEEYRQLSGEGYNMSGTIYFGDELGISTDLFLTSYYYDDDRGYEPWWWNTEIYELPTDFFERQDRGPGWERRYNN